MSSTQASVGLDFTCVPDLLAARNQGRDQGFDFILVPLVHPRNRRRALAAQSQQQQQDAFTRSDLLLSAEEWSSVIVGKISDWINLDSPNSRIRMDSEAAFREEMSWAAHLAVPAVLLPTPTVSSPNFARALNSALARAYVRHDSWLRIPLVAPHSAPPGLVAAGGPESDPWEWWNNIRSICDHNPLLSVALEITSDCLPSQAHIRRWLGEPVKAVLLCTSAFRANEAGFPVLSRALQSLVLTFFSYNAQVVVVGKPRAYRGRAACVSDYRRYISMLYASRYLPTLTDQDRFEHPFRDYLQTPLQPLMDNLESSTYETFERDPVKYNQYQEAIQRALTERHSASETAVVMVVGAGRGPLVKRTLAASVATGRPVRVYAVEKNPNAVVTLRNLHKTENWGATVTVVATDMRDWKAPELCDILVSELLGSFGDNELSPECLDGAQAYLKPTGISIPSAYTSYIAPVLTPKLFNEVKAHRDANHFETGFVVKLHSHFLLSEPRECFTFVHPNRDVQIDNNRYSRTKFPVALAALCHGFAGYFDATLYGDVHISIHPATHSPGMFSWYPIFFPLKKPTYVPSGGEIEAHFWRLCTRSKVWYEWCISSPENTPISNPGGRASWIGL